MARIDDTRQANVLVLEPEDLSRQYLVLALQRLGLAPKVAHTVEASPDLRPGAGFHLVILGLDTDVADNLARIRQVRQHHPAAVLMGVCPRMASADRCTLLDVGLDFVLEKPFFTEECLSAVQAVFRRIPTRPLTPHVGSARTQP